VHKIDNDPSLVVEVETRPCEPKATSDTENSQASTMIKVTAIVSVSLSPAPSSGTAEAGLKAAAKSKAPAAKSE
jgi:hypothetical protein